MHTDCSESVDALERAISVDALNNAIEALKKASLRQSKERKLKPAVAKKAIDVFLQQGPERALLRALQELKLLPAVAKKAIDEFLQQEPEEGLAVNAPEAIGYDNQSGEVIEMLELQKEPEEGPSANAPEASGCTIQSGSVIEMLEKLLGEFSQERAKLLTEEMKAPLNKKLLDKFIQERIINVETGDEGSDYAGYIGSSEVSRLQVELRAWQGTSTCTQTKISESRPAVARVLRQK